MAMFSLDVRKDLSAPKMPFVISVAGCDGHKAGKDMQSFRKAMASPSLLPEFNGNVFAVQTAPFWDDTLAMLQARVAANWPKVDAKVREEKDESWEHRMKHMSENVTPEEWKCYQHNGCNAGHHYLGCAKTLALMGKAFAEATVNLQKIHRSWPKDRDYFAPPTVGTLVDLDPALLVTPSKGMEAGYVPIATRQELADAAGRPHDQGTAR